MGWASKQRAGVAPEHAPAPPHAVTVRTNGLLGVCDEHVAGVGGHLVGHHDRDVELLRDLAQLVDVAAELLLALCQLAAAGELDAVQAHDGVDDHDAVRLVVLRDLCSSHRDQLVLVLVRHRLSNEQVVEDLRRVKAETLRGDLAHAVGAAAWQWWAGASGVRGRYEAQAHGRVYIGIACSRCAPAWRLTSRSLCR